MHIEDTSEFHNKFDSTVLEFVDLYLENECKCIFGGRYLNNVNTRVKREALLHNIYTTITRRIRNKF